ncbi:MAG: hypothetical protein R3C56_33225 [Pirellulaceae bacterium]
MIALCRMMNQGNPFKDNEINENKVILNALAFCLCFTLVTKKAFCSRRWPFPGAAGFGKHSVGGRGERFFEVTDLADSNDFVDHGTHWTGTFRAAASRSTNLGFLSLR